MLKNVLSSYKVGLACISEPQLFQCDTYQIFQYLEGEYCWHLNSEDLLDPELPLVKTRAHGGTLMIWLKELDPYVEVITNTSTAFLPIILKMPGLKTSIHVSIYLPTHGKDSEFVSDVADLRNCLDDLTRIHADAVIYIRGDSNVNPKNSMRVSLLQQLLHDYNLDKEKTGHNTYHHFLGNGLSDSMLDVLLHTSSMDVSEKFSNILCLHDHPGILSHHDIILSNFSIPTQDQPPVTVSNTSAPKIKHVRTKIDWSEEGNVEYSELVAPYLKQAREQWLDSSNQASMSMLLTVTNNILIKCATLTNKFKTLGSKLEPQSKTIPKVIKAATNKMSKAHKQFKTSIKSGSQNKASKAKLSFNCTKKKFREVVRHNRLKDCMKRYHKLDDIFLEPKTAFMYLKSCRKSKPTKIEKLTFGDKLYVGSEVCDGF